MTSPIALENLAGIRQEMERWQQANIVPLQEEINRLAGAVSAFQEQQQEEEREQRERARQALAARHGDSGRVYEGMGAFGLRLMESVVVAQMRNSAGYEDEQSLRDWQGRIREAREALDTSKTGDWIYTGEGSDIWRDLELEPRVFNLIRRVQMPTDPFEIPRHLTQMQFYPTAQNADATLTDLNPGNIVLTSYELAAGTEWSYTVDEDSVVALVDEAQRTFARSTEEVLEDVFINGSNILAAGTNINNRGTAITAFSANLAQLTAGHSGLRAYVLGTPSSYLQQEAAKPTAENFRELRAKMVKFGVNPSDLAIVSGIEGYLGILGLEEVQTLDKYGPGATILTGELGRLYGTPIIVSEFCRRAAGAGHVSDTAATNNRNQFLMFHRPSWRSGFRREMLIESDRDIRQRKNTSVVSFRMAIANITGTANDEPHTVMMTAPTT